MISIGGEGELEGKDGGLLLRPNLKGCKFLSTQALERRGFGQMQGMSEPRKSQSHHLGKGVTSKSPSSLGGR